jgi:hypothetical protein
VTYFDRNTSEFAAIALADGGPNNDGNFTELSPLTYDDATRPQSDEAADACDGDDDNDGISDTHELSLPNFLCPSASGPTDPLKADTDGDLRLDGAECFTGTDPAVIDAAPSVGDSDGDGVPDALDPDISHDSDGDGLADGLEFFYYGTNLAWADGDSDGCSDAKEIASINGDRSVNAIDLSQIAQHFTGSPYALPAPAHIANFDFNKDGAINAIDLGQVAQRFGSC